MKNLFSILKFQSGLLLLLPLLVLGVETTVLAEEITQPIAFSHKTHAGTNEIPCEFCHIYARRSINSGVPPVRTCFGCHNMVKGTDDTQKKEIQKVVDYWEQKKTIPWKKIHDLPDFVAFSHKRHIKAGFDCTNCHGEISEKEVITLEGIGFIESFRYADSTKTDLTMGWCVTCHKIKHPAVDGKVIRPTRASRGGKIIMEADNTQKNGVLQGSKDCLICHK
ncbi:MAG: cytochrome c3 family protein [Proteobacteria bacterium]|nr:cytochrome c3 family protein [Pseudomonadota bacterium]